MITSRPDYHFVVENGQTVFYPFGWGRGFIVPDVLTEVLLMDARNRGRHWQGAVVFVAVFANLYKILPSPWMSTAGIAIGFLIPPVLRFHASRRLSRPVTRRSYAEAFAAEARRMSALDLGLELLLPVFCVGFIALILASPRRYDESLWLFVIFGALSLGYTGARLAIRRRAGSVHPTGVTL